MLRVHLEKQLLKRNNTCADCGSKSVRLVNVTFGVFVCHECGGGHGALSPSVLMKRVDEWFDALEADYLSNMGNSVANAMLECEAARVLKPKPKDPYAAKAEFARLKYNERTFATPAGHSFPCFRVAGHDADQAKRLSVAAASVVSGTVSSLSSSSSSSSPALASQQRASPRNASHSPSTSSPRAAAHSPSSVSPRNGSPSSSPLASVTSVTSAAGGLSPGRAAKRASGQKSGSALGHRQVKAGFLLKKGGKRRNWKRRYFVLESDGTLSYYRAVGAASALGCVQLLFSNTRLLPADSSDDSRAHCLQVATPSRTYFLQASTQPEADEWVRVLRAVSGGDGAGDVSAEELNDASHQLQLSGPLHLQGRGVSSPWKRRWFVLTADRLFVYHSEEAAQKHRPVLLLRAAHSDQSLPKVRGLKLKCIDLLTCSLRSRENLGGRRYSFEVITPERTYVMAADSPATLARWLSGIRAATALRFARLGGDENRTAPRNGDEDEGEDEDEEEDDDDDDDDEDDDEDEDGDVDEYKNENTHQNEDEHKVEPEDEHKDERHLDETTNTGEVPQKEADDELTASRPRVSPSPRGPPPPVPKRQASDTAVLPPPALLPTPLNSVQSSPGLLRSLPPVVPPRGITNRAVMRRPIPLRKAPIHQRPVSGESADTTGPTASTAPLLQVAPVQTGKTTPSADARPAGAPLSQSGGWSKSKLAVREANSEKRRFLGAGDRRSWHGQATQEVRATRPKSGYLSKRGNARIKDWKRRWVVVDPADACLRYYNREGDSEQLGEIALVSCQVKPFAARKHTVQLVAPHRTYYFSASSAEEMQEWSEAIANASQKLMLDFLSGDNPSLLGVGTGGSESGGGESGGAESLADSDHHQHHSSGGAAAGSSSVPLLPGTRRQGFLQKRGNNVIKDWKRRWVVIRNCFLYYYDQAPDGSDSAGGGGQEEPLGVLNLLLCSVKECSMAKHCFEVIMPSRTYYFRARDHAQLQQWIDDVKLEISAALSHGSSSQLGLPMAATPTDSPMDSSLPENTDSLAADVGSVDAATYDFRAALLGVSALSGNQVCVDCDEPKPTWASINLGVFLCIQCSGIHRSLGVHLSQVRSVELDVWKESTVQFMQDMGNKKANILFEDSLSSTSTPSKPTPSSDRTARERYIRAKYVELKWANKKLLPPDILAAAQQSSESTKSTSGSSKKKTFHREGFLTKQGNSVKSWKRRWFVLKVTKESGIIFYYKNRGDPQALGAINLMNSAVRVAASSGRMHAFQVITPTRTYPLLAENSSDMNGWINTLQEVCDFLQMNQDE